MKLKDMVKLIGYAIGRIMYPCPGMRVMPLLLKDESTWLKIDDGKWEKEDER